MGKASKPWNVPSSDTFTEFPAEWQAYLAESRASLRQHESLRAEARSSKVQCTTRSCRSESLYNVLPQELQRFCWMWKFLRHHMPCLWDIFLWINYVVHGCNDMAVHIPLHFFLTRAQLTYFFDLCCPAKVWTKDSKEPSKVSITKFLPCTLARHVFVWNPFHLRSFETWLNDKTLWLARVSNVTITVTLKLMSQARTRLSEVSSMEAWDCFCQKRTAFFMFFLICWS